MNQMNKKLKKKMHKQKNNTGISSSVSFPKGSQTNGRNISGDLKFPDKIEGKNITPVGISTQELMKQFKKKHGLPENKVKMMLENSDNPYPSHIEKYYAMNQEFYDWITHTYNHTATESIALEYAILYDRGFVSGTN